MSKWEDSLSPRIRERLAQAGELTSDEKQRMKDMEQLDVLVAEYFKGDLSGDDFWQKLKEYKDSGSASILGAAQEKLLDTLRLGSDDDELDKRRQGVLSIESLKDKPNMPLFEQGFDAIKALKEQYAAENEQVFNSLKERVEQDPNMRIQQVQQGGQNVRVQLGVDDAVKMNPQYQQFLKQQEEKYTQAFAELMAGFKEEMK
ncbi:MAG: hypothetical protein HN929_04995 [Chloroflexi bacterium]|jgi:GrpB-like predicted nucleotidyltransferase (UPF0157 family)|nr:hypothetical protein [Chloroflexota bacterium]MBT7080809.1 hypothetical protein [Chloroflexota bacterium]